MSHRRPACASRGQEGIVLLVVVMLGAVLGIIVLQFGYLISLDSRMASSFRDSEEAYCLARAGVAQAMALLAQDKIADLEETEAAEGNIEAKPVDTLDEAWAVPEVDVPLGRGRYSFLVVDEESKFNLNVLIKEDKGISEIGALIKSLEGGESEGESGEGEEESDDPWPEDEKMVAALEWFFEHLQVDEPETIAAALANWITSNDEGKSDYGLLDPGYECKKAPLESLGELRLVLGVGERLFRGDAPERIELPPEEGEESGGEDEPFRGLRSYFTVYSDGLLNINTAGVEAIALGIRSMGEEYDDKALDLARCLVAARAETPFADLKQETLAEVECELPASLEKRFKVKSDFFTILSEGLVGAAPAEEGEEVLPRAVCRVRALVHRLDERMVILSWRVESPWEDYLAVATDEEEGM